MSDNICASEPCRLPLDATHYVCPACHGAWHRHCWDRHGGCGICGCAKEPLVAGFSSFLVDIPVNTGPPVFLAWLVLGLLVGVVWGNFLRGKNLPAKGIPLSPAAAPARVSEPLQPLLEPGAFRPLAVAECATRGLRLEVDSLEGGLVELELEDGTEMEIPLEWLSLNDKDWVVGSTVLREYGLTIQFTRSRQMRMLGPGINLSMALGQFDRQQLENGIGTALPELAQLIPAEKMKAFYDQLDIELRKEMEGSLGNPIPLARLVNPFTGTDVILLTDGGLVVNRAQFYTVDAAMQYYTRFIGEKTRLARIHLRKGDERWILDFALPTLKRAFAGPELRKGDHLHLVPESDPVHGSHPRMAGELGDLALPKDRDKLRAAMAAAGLGGPVKFVRDRARPAGN